jgi:diacylglycerol O-acyltransferase / wax synthase
MPKPDRLSAQDAAFLYAESPVAHMHVASLAIFEDRGLSEPELSAHLESRLHLVPRFRKKIAWVPAQQGRPVWVDDPHFDLRYHLRYTGLPRGGGEREALTLLGRIMSQPLDRTRPLWEMWVFELPERRMGVIQKTHHCLIDGMSGVDLSTVLLDLSPSPPPMEAPPRWVPEPAPTPARLLRDALVERWTQPREIARSVGTWTSPQRQAIRRVLAVSQGALSFGRARLMERAPLTSLSQPIGSHRRFEIVRVPLDAIKRIKRYFGCTVNDVVLALVTGGLRRLLEQRGDRVSGLLLKASVPVSVRDRSRRMTYGNVVHMLSADLPVGEPNPRRRLELIRAHMAGLKESNQAIGADFWARLGEYAPPTILALAGRASAAQRGVNLVAANVPGPQFPLYLRGGRLLEAFPAVPIMGTTSLTVAVLSYDGQLSFGLTGDYDVVPDLHVLADGIDAARTELERLATPGVIAADRKLQAG